MKSKFTCLHFQAYDHMTTMNDNLEDKWCTCLRRQMTNDAHFWDNIHQMNYDIYRLITFNQNNKQSYISIQHQNKKPTPPLFGISPKYEELDLSLLYLIPKLRKCPYKQRVYCWVCQVLNETHFQVINIYSISRQNWLQSYILHIVTWNVLLFFFLGTYVLIV
jgi:hypothetical protein